MGAEVVAMIVEWVGKMPAFRKRLEREHPPLAVKKGTGSHYETG